MTDKSIQSFNLPTTMKKELNRWSHERGMSKSRIVELLISKEIYEEKVRRDVEEGIQTKLEIHVAIEGARIWGPNKNKCNPKLPTMCMTCWGEEK